MTAVPDNLKITKDSMVVIVGLEAGNTVKQNWTKSLNIVTPPKSTGEQDPSIGSNISLIIDLLNKAERRLTFTGNIGGHYRRPTDEFPDGEQSKDINGDAIVSNATLELETMEKIFFGGGSFTVQWNSQQSALNVNADKFDATWNVNDKDDITSYGVLFTVVVGENAT